MIIIDLLTVLKAAAKGCQILMILYNSQLNLNTVPYPPRHSKTGTTLGRTRGG